MLPVPCFLPFLPILGRVPLLPRVGRSCPRGHSLEDSWGLERSQGCSGPPLPMDPTGLSSDSGLGGSSDGSSDVLALGVGSVVDSVTEEGGCTLLPSASAPPLPCPSPALGQVSTPTVPPPSRGRRVGGVQWRGGRRGLGPSGRAGAAPGTPGTPCSAHSRPPRAGRGAGPRGRGQLGRHRGRGQDATGAGRDRGEQGWAARRRRTLTRSHLPACSFGSLSTGTLFCTVVDKARSGGGCPGPRRGRPRVQSDLAPFSRAR